jgi:rubrerythrin
MQVLLELAEIRTDGGTQSRAALDQATVDEYAELMLSGVEFPPVVVYADDLENWLAEGFHRYAAATKAGLQAIKATVVSGDRRAALLHSLTSNAKHGLRRTNNDKRHCVTLMLQDEEWAAWSDNQIAKTCNVSQPFVSEIRKSLTYNVISEDGERTFTTKHGTQAAMKTANIGKKKAGVQPKTSDEYACNACGEVFDRETWHCPTCNQHWPAGRDTCLNCYKAPEVTTVKLSPVASGQDGVTNLQDAFDWKKISESYHTENALLKKELQGYMQTLDLIESENGKFIPAPSEQFDPSCDRDYWPEHDNAKLGDVRAVEAGLAAELAQAVKDKAHWFGVAEQLREDLDEAKALLTQLEEEEMEFLRGKLEEAKKEGEGWYC